MIEGTTATFQNNVIEESHKRPVLVDFYAPWCGPCKMMAPILEELAEVMGDTVSVVKIDVDAEGQLGQQYDIRSIPTLYIFVQGEIVGRMMGIQSIGQLKSALEQFIK